MAAELYDNGMVKLQSRMEDEFWYADYQTVCELITYNSYNSLGEFAEAAVNEIASYREIPDKMQVAIRLWCVLHWERNKNRPL